MFRILLDRFASTLPRKKKRNMDRPSAELFGSPPALATASPWEAPSQSLGDRVARVSDLVIAIISFIAIALSLLLRYALHAQAFAWRAPLVAVLLIGGSSLVIQLARKAFSRQFGADWLAGISIVTSALLGEYLAGAIIVLMLSGGTALEQFATRKASSALAALARRMPHTAHRQSPAGIIDISVTEIQIGDRLVIFPHEICPTDGVIAEGHGRMDEAYLTGEPFEIAKAPGSAALSGAVNGSVALVMTATRLPIDSRYAQIMKVMEQSEASRPPLRRLADRIGTWYTPLALLVAALAGVLGGSSHRFLAVVIIATPCPLLIAIPVAMIGAISLCARNGIVIKNAGALEQVGKCESVIFDKTGTLTYGKPALQEIVLSPGRKEDEVLALTASLEQYSKHPLAGAVLRTAQERKLYIPEASQASEEPGEGLRGIVAGQQIEVLGRKHFLQRNQGHGELPQQSPSGLECVVLVNDSFAALLKFADEPRAGGSLFVGHLQPRHGITRVMLLSGDRQSEVENLARMLGIPKVHANKSPEEKVRIVAEETLKYRTLFVGDGLNDAPAMKAATVGVAFGHGNEITSQAADAVILDPVIQKVDELMHIGQHTRTIALQSAIGGMTLSVLGMVAASLGYLPPVAGAIAQEIIDVVVVLNALRVLIEPRRLADL